MDLRGSLPRGHGRPGGGPEAGARRLASQAVAGVAGYIEGEEIRQVWDSRYVAWSLVIAAFGAYVSFTTTMYMKQVANTRWYWLMLVQAGLSLGVCTIWCMHFVGMQALVLKGGVQSGAAAQVHITFEPVFTVVSALAAWLIAAVALYIALGRQDCKVNSAADLHRRSLGGMSRPEISGKLTPDTVKRISSGAALVTLGVCVMHYMGMLSQTGRFTMSYDPFVMGISAMVAAVASWAGLFIFFILFDSVIFRAASAVVVSAAVNGMHYTGMQSARYYASQQRGIWGNSTVALELPALHVLIGVLLLNFFLMAVTGYYVEVLETVRKREGEAFEKELRYKNYCKESNALIQRSRIMRYPMCLVRYDTFVRHGKLVAHETMRDASRLVYIETAHAAMKQRKKRFIVFFSHQWLSSKIPDPTNRQFQDMLAALADLSKVYRVKTEHMYIWVDYSSIPQEGLDQQQLAIDSITTYVSVASAFVIVAPQVLHTVHQTPCNFMTYSKRCWCRLEVFCSLLSTLRHKPGSTSQAIPEEDGEEEDVGTDSQQPHPPGQEGAQAALTGAARSALALTVSEKERLLHEQGTIDKDRATLPEQHRVFLIVDDQLHRLNFFTKEGNLRKDYEELLYVFSGDLECCARGHIGPDGREIICDKMKLVPSLCGCYGAMLEDLRRSQRKSQRHPSMNQHARWGLAELVVKQRHEIFPPEFFDTRIEAMQTQVETLAANRRPRPELRRTPSTDDGGAGGGPEQDAEEDSDKSESGSGLNSSDQDSSMARMETPYSEEKLKSPRGAEDLTAEGRV